MRVKKPPQDDHPTPGVWHATQNRPVDVQATGLLESTAPDVYNRILHPPRKQPAHPRGQVIGLELQYERMDTHYGPQVKCSWRPLLELGATIRVRTNAHIDNGRARKGTGSHVACVKRPEVEHWVEATLANRSNALYGCAFWSIFRVGATLQERLDAVLASSRIRGRYAAVHIRSGDGAMTNDTTAEPLLRSKHYRHRREHWIAAVNCADALGQRAGMPSNGAVFVASDSAEVKAALRDVFGTRIVLHKSAQQVGHIDKSEHLRDTAAKIDVVLDSLVDFFLLAGAEHIVAPNPSGFSRSAAAIGGITVHGCRGATAASKS